MTNNLMNLNNELKQCCAGHVFGGGGAYTRAKIDQIDATLYVERLNIVVIKVQQHLLNSQC